MDLQLTLTIILVALASCYLAVRGWKLWRRAGKSCGGCGSSSATSLGNKDKIVAISLEKLRSNRPKER